MRSAYGLKIPDIDPELTRVGPGTPCGELMRRYWQPVCQSADLGDLPKRIRILGEDLVAFRDGQGRPGLLFFRCSHRGTSLEYGRVERDGLRCCYHGWLYDVEGRILDMPLEPPDSTVKDHIWHPAYPVQEYGGLLFAYMGPLEKMPLLPRYDVLEAEGGTLKARFGPRVGGAQDCNWLQSEENLMDALHAVWLHTVHSGAQFPTQAHSTLPERLVYEETDLGIRFVMTRRMEDGRWADVIWENIMPLNVHLTYTDEPVTEKVDRVSFCVPVDDTHQLGASIRWVPDGTDTWELSGREKLAPAGRGPRNYEYSQRYPDDKEAQESQGEIVLHAMERHVSSDEGVLLFRKILKTAIDDVKAGKDPKGIIRDHEKAACVATTSGAIVYAERPAHVA
ncbi:MAG: Rieske 2Fe-2S domain-containing protein [Deltaproteobacteria bacterium]|nr:Rieske 2Fe-2S domain-containing protein [Deltaproteobacteria bacterium]